MLVPCSFAHSSSQAGSSWRSTAGGGRAGWQLAGRASQCWSGPCARATAEHRVPTPSLRQPRGQQSSALDSSFSVLPAHLSACPPARLPACPPTYLPARPPARLPACPLQDQRAGREARRVRRLARPAAGRRRRAGGLPRRLPAEPGPGLWCYRHPSHPLPRAPEWHPRRVPPALLVGAPGRMHRSAARGQATPPGQAGAMVPC